MKKTVFLIPFLAILLVGAACTKQETSSTNTTTTEQLDNTPAAQNTNASSNTNRSPSIQWEFNGSTWSASAIPPTCPDPLTIASPVNVQKTTSILYPGQTRGGQYKPHGGFRFDGVANNAVTVTVPLDAQVVSASRYLEAGETQYLFDLQTPCGIRFRFDHLLTLSPAFARIAQMLPAAKKDDSRTTTVEPPVAVSQGDTIAMAVGFAETQNTSVDFGVYDLRKTNTASASIAWKNTHQEDRELGWYGICWFDLLPETDATWVKNLPPGDAASGTTSDFCGS